MTRQTSKPEEVNVQESNLDAFTSRMDMAIKRAGGVTKVSKDTGMSPSVIRKWRAGQSDPSRTSLIKVARAAGVSLEWLATGEGDPDGRETTAQQDLAPDFDALEEIITKLRQVLRKNGASLRPDAEAKIVRTIYEYYLTQGKDMDERTLNNVIELAAFR